jgi:murein DD-endopeptidase MepM/ murein hydrolase activator NlpD
MSGARPPILAGPQRAAASAMPRQDRQVTVERGMSVGKLAVQYHVSKQAIIAANHLEPPEYKVKLGHKLTIPGTAAPAVQQAMMPPSSAAPTSDVIPLDDPPGPRASSPHASGPPPVVSPPAAATLSPRPPTPPSPAPVAALPPPTPPSPPPQPAPAPVAAPMPQPAPASAAPVKSIAFPPREPSAAEEARAEAAASAALPQNRGGGHFPWPLRGRMLASYGVAADGTHNDGINIAAPRGTPIEAVDAGIVAYAGNELRGYGNLVLVKHGNGWISAYAHCDELLVKKGDPVYRGKVIAKVGATGGVSEPQLHFELRQGKRPVDPRGYLGAAPDA